LLSPTGKGACGAGAKCRAAMCGGTRQEKTGRFLNEQEPARKLDRAPQSCGNRDAHGRNAAPACVVNQGHHCRAR